MTRISTEKLGRIGASQVECSDRCTEPLHDHKFLMVRRRALCAEDPAVSVKIRGIRALAIGTPRESDQAVVKIRPIPPDRVPDPRSAVSRAGERLECMTAHRNPDQTQTLETPRPLVRVRCDAEPN